MSKKLCFLMVILALLWSMSPAFGQAPAGTPGRAKILVEYWLDIGAGTAVTDLTSNARFPNDPTASLWLDSWLFPAGSSGGSDWKNNYGDRERGYVWPPKDGDYTFWVAGDDACELWLSTDDTPANAKLIAQVTGWTDAMSWDGTSGSTDTAKLKSAPVTLKAGKKYYMETLHKEGGGGDSVGVAWAGPAPIGPTHVLLAGKYCSVWIRDPEPMFMARDPKPADGETGVLISYLSWTAGGTATSHDVYFGTDPNPPKVGRQTWAVYMGPPLIPGTTYYWRIDEIEAGGKVLTGKVWSFTAAPLTAYSPTPRNGDKWIDPSSDLAWQGGAGAESHDVYFGTDKNLVASRDPSVKKGDKLLVPLLDLPTLQVGTVYYWLVDEYDAGGVIHQGEVWSFTTNDPASPGGIKGEYFANTNFTGAPALTRIDPGIDFSWADGTPPGTGIGAYNWTARWTADLEIAVADTYTFTANTDDGVRLWLNDKLIIDDWVDRAPSDSISAPLKLDPGIYSLKMEFYQAGGGAAAHLSWQTPTVASQIIPPGPLQPPVRAKPIYPQSGDVNVPQDLTLMWSTGEKAVTHDVYFGEDANAVAAATPATTGIYKGSQAKDENTFTPGALEWGKTYYWKVDEVNAASPQSPWKGAVWSFTTANFLVVDNFESYTDDVTGRIFQTWIDGWGFTEPAPGNPGNGTGATVGYIDPPFAEHSIVHGGGTSMPLGYNNADSPNYSETDRTFDSPQNWTVNGVNTLSLQVRGYPEVNNVSVTETGGKMTLTGAGTDIWGTYDQFTYAFKSLSGDGTLVAEVTNIGPGTNTWAKGGVMIRDSLDGGSAYAITALTANSDGAAGNGACFQWRPSADASATWSGTGASSAVTPPYWVKIERLGDTFNGYISPDGSTWTAIGTVDIAMSNPVYVGICVTSHQAGEQRTFQFESIKTTGSATGAWQGAVINSPRSNSPQDFYVAIQDSTNKIAVVKNATVVTATTWTEVKMPLSAFTGVSMTKVKKLIIGVGDRTSPVADGTGKLFIDDIRVIKE